jgi:hypothetical protein
MNRKKKASHTRLGILDLRFEMASCFVISEARALVSNADFGSRCGHLSFSDLSQHRGMYSYMPHCKLHKLLRYAHFRFYQFHLKVLRSIFSPFNTFVRRKAWLQGSCRPRLRRHSHRRSQVSGSRGPLLLRRHTPTGFRMHSARRMRSFHRRSFRRSSCRGSGRRASRER